MARLRRDGWFLLLRGGRRVKPRRDGPAATDRSGPVAGRSRYWPLAESTRRNMAAHPSSVVMIQYQAEDAITDLVNNVVLKLR